jgi:hypothetical protein
MREPAAGRVFDRERAHGSPWTARRSMAAKTGGAVEALRERLRRAWRRRGARTTGRRPPPLRRQR